MLRRAHLPLRLFLPILRAPSESRKRDAMLENDTSWMRQALRLAARGRGRTSPNPMVGCVLVKQGQLVGSGWHHRAGEPHAEVLALRDAGTEARGGTAYVTLEPCAHQGRTPPCSDALIAAGVARVVAAMQDPDPRTAGKGLAALKRAGIGAEVGVMESEARKLNQEYILHRTHGRPFVTYKVGMSVDGRTAAADGSSRWITSEESRRDAHRLRAQADAICAGIGTVLVDDPLLTVRGVRRAGPHLRVVVDSQAQTPVGAKVLTGGDPTVIFTTTAGDDPAVVALVEAGAEVVTVPADRNGRVALPEAMGRLAERGVLSLLLEGGATLAAEFMRCGFVDRYVFYVAPSLIGASPAGILNGWAAGSIEDRRRLTISDVRRVGPDLKVTAYPMKQVG